MKPETKRIYDRMPREDQARVDRVAEPTKTKLVELWATIRHDGETGEELASVARERDNERILAASLSGKNGDRARAVIQKRVAACPRVTGKTMEALKAHDREHYRRFLEGSTRAIRREAALADGTLSLGDLAELRRRYSKQREIDQYAADFPDFDDYGGRVSP